MPECHSCGQPIDPLTKVGIRDDCAKCHRDLHVCKNCRFWDSSAHNQCREPQAEYVPDREKSNFCTFFTPGAGQKKMSRSAAEAKKKLDALFKK
ncbi:MAG: hypothetical protein HY897_24870 [Deltaproteobacteria bacterium]|nr:hypothetical protein [Deltaproteobacteria bacterium]